MCGIVGYTGPREAAELLVEGLARLEYRGYDSAGLTVQNGRGLVTHKLAGRVGRLAGRLATWTATAKSPWSTTASSRTPTCCARAWPARGTASAPIPIPKPCPT